MPAVETASKLGELAYQRLQQKLWNGELSPGDKLSESRLAAELGMSRTPLREAIRRLEKEGVLQQVASSGTFVKLPDRSAIVEAYEVRIAIECFAVQKAARRMKPAQVKQLQKLCDQMLAAIRAFRDSGRSSMRGRALQSYLTADINFHLLLLQAADNQRAMGIYCDVNLLSSIFGCRSHERDLHHVAWVWLQHARVARAVRRRDPQAALRALERHMRSSMEAALEAYEARLRGKAPPTVPQPDYTRTMAGLIVRMNGAAD